MKLPQDQLLCGSISAPDKPLQRCSLLRKVLHLLKQIADWANASSKITQHGVRPKPRNQLHNLRKAQLPATGSPMRDHRPIDPCCQGDIRVAEPRA